jgi:uncharacterized protein (DUF2062 family)
MAARRCAYLESIPFPKSKSRRRRDSSSARGFGSRETDKKSERNDRRKNRRHERAWRGCAHTAVAVLTKLGCYFWIAEAPANVVAAILVVPAATVVILNPSRTVPVIHRVQVLAEAAQRHEHFYDVRKLPARLI